MIKSRYTLLYLLAGLWMMVLSTACEHRMVYNHYEHVTAAGWEKTDDISFDVRPVSSSGKYAELVELRINHDYPFTGLTLIVEQTIYPSKVMRCDTLNCQLIDQQGNTIGNGVSQYQYQFPLTTLRLAKNDSLHVSIRHDMKREILGGITDVGFCLQVKQ